MIGNWLAYVYNYLIVRLRQPRLVGFIMALIKPGRMLFSSLYSYIDDSRLRSAATWQVCWLEKLLTDILGYPVQIMEADGQPVDFHVLGVEVQHINLASALLNRYKLAGRSYVFISISGTAKWLNPVCAQTEEIIHSARWVEPVCAGVSQLLTFQINIQFTWMGDIGQPGLIGGISGEVKLLTSMHAISAAQAIGTIHPVPTATISFTPILNPDGYRVSFKDLTSWFNNDHHSSICVWDTSASFDNPQYTDETDLITRNTSIFVKVY